MQRTTARNDVLTTPQATPRTVNTHRGTCSKEDLNSECRQGDNFIGCDFCTRKHREVSPLFEFVEEFWRNCLQSTLSTARKVMTQAQTMVSTFNALTVKIHHARGDTILNITEQRPEDCLTAQSNWKRGTMNRIASTKSSNIVYVCIHNTWNKDSFCQ